MGRFGDWVNKKVGRAPAAARGTIERFDEASGTGSLRLAQGGTRDFRLDQCMFTPFEGLPVLVEDAALRLAPEAHPRYGELLEQHAASRQEREEQAAERYQAQRQERFAEFAARRPVDARLEAALEQAPDDLESLQVYADVLQQQGHELGRLIAVACALERGEGDAAALQREHDRLRDAQLEALGLPEGLVRLEWRRGLIEAARLGCNWPDDMLDPDGDDWPDEVLARLLGAPAARFLRRLTLGLLDEEGVLGADLFPLLERCGPLGALRELVVGDFVRGDEMELSWTTLNRPPPYLALPSLERLELQAGELELGEIVLPSLRSFEVRTGGLTSANLAAIVGARWPRLRRLCVWFGDPGYGAEGGVEDLGPLLAGEGLPELGELGLCNAIFADELCGALPDAPVLARLRVLDLSRGALTDAGARALAQQKDRLAHLERLDVADCCLSPAGVALLESLPCPVVIGEQREGDEDARYVAVGE